MAWWNPLSWFASYDPKTATAAQVLDRVDVIEDGKQESVEVLRDAVEAGDKYLFEVQMLAGTGEIIYVVPFGEGKMPLQAGDRVSPFVVTKVLLTLVEAARLKILSKFHGGDGLAKTAEDIKTETPAEPLLSAPTFFDPEALETAKPDQVLTAKPIKDESLGV